ncbi:MAG: PH domain-containing protein [Nakamurella sp.]
MDHDTQRDLPDLFAPPGESWRGLSPRYRAMRSLTSAVVIGVLTLVPAVVVALTSGLWWLVGMIVAVGFAGLAVRLVVIGRNFRSWGYAERPTDLYLTHGVLFRRLVAVPYGRMQLVEVTSGPLQRGYGLATVRLQTASPGSGARIPGLTPAEAVRLRDRLTERGQSQAAAL